MNPLQSERLELEVIAAAVIGGTLLSGGYGSIIGALFGVLITGMLRTGLVQLRVPAACGDMALSTVGVQIRPRATVQLL